jgi:hypothetical protein
MIQDAYVYHRIRNGAEIRHSELLGILSNCGDPGNLDRVHPELRTFWAEALRGQFPADYAQMSPMIDEWNAWYLGAMSIAGRPAFLGRLADPEHKVTYRITAEITPEQRARLIDRLPYPGGTMGSYDGLFEKAVTAVATRWTGLAQALSGGTTEAFLARVTNCNLDTGADI